MLLLSIPAGQSVLRSNPSMSHFLSATSDPQACLSSVDAALSQMAPLSSQGRDQLLQVAEGTSAFQDFEATNGPPLLVPGGPAIEYHTSPNCSGVSVEAFTFNFVASGRQIAIAVDPSSLSVLRTFETQAVSHGVVKNFTNPTNGCCWGGGYEYWNGSTYSNPTYPWYYIEAFFHIPSVSTSDTNQDDYSIWSGLTDTYGGTNIAQTGMDAYAQSGHTSSYKLWYEFYPAGSNYCTFTVYSGDSLFAESYSNAYSTSGGSASTYNENTYDSNPNVANGCSYYNYSWGSGLSTHSYFALMMGETLTSVLENFGHVNIIGTIYDNHYGGGPSGHCTSTPYNQGFANSFWYSYGGHKATETLDSGYCSFYDDYK